MEIDNPKESLHESVLNDHAIINRTTYVYCGTWNKSKRVLKWHRKDKCKKKCLPSSKEENSLNDSILNRATDLLLLKVKKSLR